MSSGLFHQHLLTLPTVRPVATPGTAAHSGDDLSINEYDIDLEDKVVEPLLNYEIAQENIDEYGQIAADTNYSREKASLIGKYVNVKGRKGKEVVKWTIRKNIEPSEVTATYHDPKNDTVGVRGFDFNNHTVNSNKGNQPRINMMHLLFHLFPINVKESLDTMNQMISKENIERVQNRRQKIPYVSFREFGIFLGILIVARLEGKKGSSMWKGNPDDGEGYRSQLDMSQFMTLSRHTQIRTFFAFAFADTSQEGKDPWWQVLGGINGFNKNRNLQIASSRHKVLDESMSSFRPRTTATGM